ncbi:YitT family protein [Candidatus Ventrimonas sp. KK005]|nr:YitT family protein [Lachnospiraceae bacterium]NBH16557.1 YitT family protein [Clostridiaceae bacterium]
MFEKYKHNLIVRRIITIMAVMASALLQTFVIQSFIRPAQLLSGGFTGIAILLDDIASLYGKSFSTSLGILVLNIPVAILCSKSISKRFTFYSVIQVFLASLFLKICDFQPIFQDLMLNVLFGGFLYGIAIAMALRGNASTGGTDFIALYVSNKTGRSIWEYVFAGNVLILCVFGYMFGWLYAGYSILFQFVSTKTISAFHHRYERVTLQITTTKAEEVIRAYVSKCRHGISCVEAIGGYSRQKMYLLHTVVSSYEAADIIRLMRAVDPHIIINIIKTENFVGGFYQAPMD